MKTIRNLSFIFLVLGLLTSLTGCRAQTPRPLEPTPTLEAAKLSETALVERALSAVEALNQPDGFSYSLQSTTFTHIKIIAGEDTLSDDPFLQAMSDKGTWLMQGNQVNAAVLRHVSYPGSDFYALNGEMHLVDGQVYVRAAFDQPRADLPAMPDGWIHLNGQSTLRYWPNIQELNLPYSLPNIQEEPWSLLSSYPSQVLAEVLAGHLETAQHEATTLPDGSPGEILTFTIKSSALKHTIRYLEEADPIGQRVLAAVQGSPITMRFTLDQANRLVEWNLAIKLELQGVDLTGTIGIPDGALLDAKGEQNVSVHLQRDPKPVALEAPDAGEIVKLPPYSGAGPSPLFGSLEDFDVRLNRAISEDTLDTFWQQLSSAQTMPLIFDDLAVFLYRGEAHIVDWIGDWSGYDPYRNNRLDGTDVWMYTVRLPRDARLEYQIRVDGGEPILDPLNPAVETGGLGSKSVMQMPEYVSPDFVIPRAEVAQGILTTDTPFASQRLGYDVNYRVYTPAEYTNLHNLPVLYVTDGQDFLTFGKLAVALDNLIANGHIQPVIAVFIDPRNVKTGENQRNEQFFDNPQYGQFIAKELVPEIDRLYRTDPSPDARLIIGASNGGYHSIYFALNHSDTFHLIVAFSPSLWHNPEIIETYRKEANLPLKFFISTGLFNDNDYYTRKFRDMLQGKDYTLLYMESSEGHSYGNWRGKFDEMLEFFFPTDSSL